jgi:hypothetical protein
MEIPMPTHKNLTQRAFAKLVGLSHGRIAELVSEGLPVEPGGGIDPDRGRSWIANNLDPKRRLSAKPSLGFTSDLQPPDASPLAQMRTKKLQAEARLAELDVLRRTRTVVSRADVTAAAFGRARFERDAWHGWAARAASELAAASGGDAGITFTTLDRLVREHLAELAKTPWSVDGSQEDA